VCQTGDADELFEIARNELRAVVGDDSRFGVWIFFQAALEADLHVGFSHGLAQFPVYDCAGVAVEQRAEVEEGPELQRRSRSASAGVFSNLPPPLCL
jgi:hypothetical protein